MRWRVTNAEKCPKKVYGGTCPTKVEAGSVLTTRLQWPCLWHLKGAGAEREATWRGKPRDEALVSPAPGLTLCPLSFCSPLACFVSSSVLTWAVDSQWRRWMEPERGWRVSSNNPPPLVSEWSRSRLISDTQLVWEKKATRRALVPASCSHQPWTRQAKVRAASCLLLCVLVCVSHISLTAYAMR